MIQEGDDIENLSEGYFYHVIRLINSGGFGFIFEVEDRLNSNSIKVIKVLNIDSSIGLHYVKKVIELFQQEYDFMNIASYPGIPTVDRTLEFTCPHTGESLRAIVMEKIEGIDLLKWIQKGNRISNQGQAIQWLEEITKTLKVVHDQGYFHRDIKPSNIMLRDNGQLVLIDFGAAKEQTQQAQAITTTGTRIGSPGYSSPEQQLGRTVIQSDFFALGRTFVHLLTGHFPDDNFLINWRQSAEPKIPEEFKDLIDDLMERNASQRPKNTNRILKDLERIRFINPYNKRLIILNFFINILLLTLILFGIQLNPGVKIILCIFVIIVSFLLLVTAV